MCEIRKFSYEEMVANLNRKELIIIDTNVWLDLFVNYSCKEIEEIFNSIKKEYYIHEVFVVPHIIEEYVNGKKKVKNTFDTAFKQSKEQLLKIYTDMKKRINEFDKSFYNCVGYQNIVDSSNFFYDDIKQKIDSLLVGDTTNFDEKEKIIDNFLSICKKNYDKVKKYNKSIQLSENLWKSDSRKNKNPNGDFIIWNEILEISANYNCEKVILIENEKKNEWNNTKLEESLKRNSSANLEIIDFKTFVCEKLPSISYSLFCKCVNNYDRFHQFINISNCGELYNNYSKLMNDFIPMTDSEFLIDAKFLIENDVRCLNFESSIKSVNIIIEEVEPLSKKTNVITTLYDEVRLNHTFKQRVKCSIILNNDRNKTFLFDKIYFEYNIVSNRVLMNDSRFLEEWIDKSVDYDFVELKMILKKFI